MDKPLVSVIIPAYNAKDYIGQTILSVLNQDYSNLELIVVDDGSTDKTADIALSFKGVRVISQENKGQAVAKNVGLANSNGPLIGIIDADDLWPKNHISLMVPYLVSEAPYDLACGMTQYLKQEEGKDVKSEPVFLEWLAGASLYRKSIFDKVGLFDESMREGEDFDWLFRLKESDFKGKKIPETTLFYRRHQKNFTNNRSLVALGQLRSLRNKIKRSR